METKQELNKALQRFISQSRVVEGFNPETELWNLLCPLFGDTRIIQRTGLVKQFNALKISVIDKNLIGLIIYGANIKDENDKVIDDYPTQMNTVITLTLKSVCQALLDDHMTDYEIISLINKE